MAAAGSCETFNTICGTPYHLFDAPFGLAATDALVSLLQDVSGLQAPAFLRRDRDILIDVMADAAPLFSGTPIAVAGEQGTDICCAVIAARLPVASRVPARRVVIGDFDDFERYAKDAACSPRPFRREKCRCAPRDAASALRYPYHQGEHR